MKRLNPKHIALLLLNVLMLFFWYLNFNGFFFYDDITYARYAHAMLQGEFSPAADHFGHRVGLIFLWLSFMPLEG